MNAVPFGRSVTAAGFADPVLQSQRVFRALLTAQSQPGRVVAVEGVAGPQPLCPATVALLLTLADRDTPLWLDLDPLQGNAVSAYLRFHCGCPIVASSLDAVFTVLTRPALMPELTAFALGSDEYPDRSATLIVQVDALLENQGRCLTGPGIAGERRLRVEGLPGFFWSRWRSNHALFPRGVDVILTQADRLAALPRSVRVAEEN
jgi:alpha-D-ribose 1-methylphosphonate 5-triphosphate synthase subunit PhnH